VAIIDDFDGFLIDLDGVVWIGDSLVPGSDGAVAMLRELGKRVLFLTNDPRSSGAETARKLYRLGLEVAPTEVLTAGAATAMHIAQHEEVADRSAFVIGTRALKEELQAVGLSIVEGEGSRQADLVVVGAHRGFDYTELRRAAQAVRRGASFYATGRDPTFPMPDGPWPATGAILAAVETAAGRRAHAVGKPEPDMFRVAVAMIGDPSRCAVVGDRLDSDIAGGRAAGLPTVLVLTGSTSETEAARASPAPDFVVADLMALVRGEEGPRSGPRPIAPE
jgi:phosphoglycolate/pyridoxal phosphate phosphatase family enzyme